VKKLASASDPLWYKDAIIYEVHVRAFADSNNDGIGDFPGLLSRLDYLQGLGITCIWLLPFFPSPLRDDGYDIANYVDVNPVYGTLSDFKEFLDAAHRRNMQVMIELVINHTSDQHPWFKAARAAPAGSPERDMYVWSQSDEIYKDARIIFTDTEKSNWTWDETANAYYWHRFFSHQPDLNFDNPRVLQEVLKAMRFWLDMGVDALRMDAIPYLVERDGTSCENLPETHAMIKAIRAAIDAEYANRLVLAEANQWPADVRPYFGDGDECHMAFHFPLMPRIYMALRQEDRLPITDIMAQTPPIPDNCQWGLFLRNHDELTLEMVTDDERDYMYFAYSADPRMRINVGIRRRLAPLVDNNRRRIELLNSLLLSFPGTPILYYGDELGMGDNIYLGDRNGVRTPMQWTSDRNAGFSKTDPARLYFPVIMDPIYGYQVINVEAQLADQSSLLHWTRNMIALRKLFQVFGRGTLTFLNPANRKILAYLRDLDRGDGTHETVLCVANLSRFAQPVSLDLSEYAGMEPVEMLGYVSFPTITESEYQLTVAPYSFIWLELQPASAETESEAEKEPVAAESALREAPFPDLIEAGWTGLVNIGGLAQLENALPAWLPRQRWFGAKSRRIASCRVLHWVDLSQSGADAISPARVFKPAIFYVEVAFVDGEPNVYQVPLTLSTGRDADDVSASYAESIITTFTSSAGLAVLHDAIVLEDFRQILLTLIERNFSFTLSSGLAPDRVKTDSTSVAMESERVGKGRRTPTDLASATGVAEEIDRAGHSGQRHSGGFGVAPKPLSAQPGEAASAPRSDAETIATGSAPHKGPRASASSAEDDSSAGRLAGQSSKAFANTEAANRAPSRTGSAEQSNTSIIYGDKLILKFFRRLEPGQNPDVEIGRFLTEEAQYPRIAPFLGEVSLYPNGEKRTTAAMLQGLVTNSRDGWEWFLDQVAGFLSGVGDLSEPLELQTPSFAAERTPLAHIPDTARLSLKAAALLGQRTAELHLALSSSSELPDFAPEPLLSKDLERDEQRIQAQVSSSLEALKQRITALDDPTSDMAGLLLSKRRELIARSRFVVPSAAAGQRIRIHGDFHLGQTLRVGDEASGGDFVFLDFEGEPARPLEERRRKESPLRDVAGMIRSFSYVTHAGLRRFLDAGAGVEQTADTNRPIGWARFWQNQASAEFIAAYRETIAANAALLPPPAQAQVLLDAFLLEKALYELLYELNHRPSWLQIPIAGILSLLK
jgi:maltose alpha-D-glucosyltransferase/alpha-amylase